MTMTPPLPPEIRQAAFLLSQISGHPAVPVYDQGWRFRFDLSPEDAAAIISAADNPQALAQLMAPLFTRFRRTSS